MSTIEIGNNHNSNNDDSSVKTEGGEDSVDDESSPSKKRCLPLVTDLGNDGVQLPDPAEIIGNARKMMAEMKMTQADIAFVLNSSMSSISRLFGKAGESFLSLSDHNRKLLVALDEWMKGQLNEVREVQPHPVAEPLSVASTSAVTQPVPKTTAPAICVTTIPGYLLVFKKLRLSSSNGVRLFDNATLSIAVGRRYGLIGSRHSGTSELLSYIESANKKMDMSAGIEVALCNNSFDNDPEITNQNETTIDFVVQRAERWGKLKAEEASLEKILTIGKNPEVASRLKKIYEQLHFFVAGDAELKARILLTGLGFPVASQNGPVQVLNQNDRKIARLAQALLTEPDLLLLDHPTSCLDIDSIKFLENYLKGWRNSLVVVSQDRTFLDAVCSDIIQARDKQLFYYEGNYSSFEQVPKT